VVQNALNEINLKRFHDNKLKEEIIVKLTNNLESIRTNSAKAKKKILDSSNKKNEGTKMTYKQKVYFIFYILKKKKKNFFLFFFFFIFIFYFILFYFFNNQSYEFSILITLIIFKE